MYRLYDGEWSIKRSGDFTFEGSAPGTPLFKMLSRPQLVWT